MKTLSQVTFVILCLLFSTRTAAAPTCNPTVFSFSEDFLTSTYRDSAVGIGGWGYNRRVGQTIDESLKPPSGVIGLQKKGGVFFDRSSANFGNSNRMPTGLAQGDFDKDGKFDFVATCDGWRGESKHSSSGHSLVFYKGDGTGKFTETPLADPSQWGGGSLGIFGDFESNTLTSGDLDGDGDTDFIYRALFLQSWYGFQRTPFSRTRYFINKDLTNPSFTNNFFPSLSPGDSPYYPVYFLLGGSGIILVDLNNDGRADILTGSSGGNSSSNNKVLVFYTKSDGKTLQTPPTTLIADTGLRQTIGITPALVHFKDFTVPEPDAQADCTATSTNISYGITAVMAEDFDGDGDIDIITGSQSESTLKYWKQQNGVYVRASDITLPTHPGVTLGGINEDAITNRPIGGVRVAVSEDLDGDGDADLILGIDGKSCHSRDKGSVWLMDNDGSGNFSIKPTINGNPSPLAQVGDDLDWLQVLDVNNDGLVDIMAGAFTRNGDYRLLKAKSSNYYNSMGVAVSKKINGNTSAISSVRVTNLIHTIPSGATITYLVSNDGGLNWETLSASEIANKSWHYFKYFGNDLRWQAQLSAPPVADFPPGDEAFFGSAIVSPTIDLIAFEYSSVDPHFYSRSALTTGTFKIGPLDKEYLYSAAFEYPGFAGHLYAYDLTDKIISSGAPSSLTTVSSTPLFDAGDALTQSAVPRKIYTVATNNSLTTLSQLANDSPTSLGVADSTAATTLVNYVTDSMGTGHKLFDLGHSSPIFVGTPPYDPNYAAYGPSYNMFKSANSGRKPLVYIGSNGGMMHAFDATTGEEFWGFVPKNLQGKLITQRQVIDGGAPVYRHNQFVDGSLVPSDVIINGNWRSIVIGGQAQGKGADDNNYYFAMDVTNPDNPNYLWEFTDSWAGSSQACTGAAPLSGKVCYSQETATSCTSTCDAANRKVWPLYVTSTATIPSADASKLEIRAELEQYSSRQALDGNWTQLVIPGDSSYSGGFSAQPNYIQLNVKLLIPKDDCYYFWIRSKLVGSQFKADFTVGGLVGHIAYVDNLMHWSLATNDARVCFDLKKGENVFRLMYYFNPNEANQPPVNPAPTFDSLLVTNKNITSIDDSTQFSTTTCDNFCLPADAGSLDCSSNATISECPPSQICCTSETGKYCAPSCSAIDTVLGETWSAPLVTRVLISGEAKWVVFFGSGYRNHAGLAAVGRSIYMLDVATGVLINRWDINDIAYNASTNPSTIDNSIPGNANVVDTDNDGYSDRLYIGDLEGRMWKLVLDSSLPPGDWPTCVLFDAGDPTGSGSRIWAPIATKPAIALLSTDGHPNVYFGTGGDDRSPDSQRYKFYSVKDTDENGECRMNPLRNSDLSAERLEWVLGDDIRNDTNRAYTPTELLANPEGEVGDRFWSDPVIANSSAIYIASLPGKIDSVDPCSASDGKSKIYALAIRKFTDALGYSHKPGMSIFNTQPWLQAASKVRQSLYVRNAQAESSVHTVASNDRTNSSDVFLQEFTQDSGVPPAKALANVGVAAPGRLRVRILRWRELPVDSN